MYGFQWQFYPSLGLSFTSTKDDDFPSLRYHWLIIACFQFRWTTLGHKP